MDSPLRLLRDILPFRQASADEKSVAMVRGLLDTITGLSAKETVTKLASSVLPKVSQQTNLQMRYKLLEEVRMEAERSLPLLETEISQAILPLPVEATSAALDADNLLKSLAVCYAHIAQSIRKHQLNGTLSQLYHRCAQRAMALVARRQFLAYRAYATPSAGSWKMLHQLYILTRGPQGTPLNGETAPVEHEYLGALVFAYLEPGKLPRNELENINICSRQLAAYASVSEVAPETNLVKAADSVFVVRPEEGAPGRPMARMAVGSPIGGCLLIDCSQVLSAIDRNITRRPGKSVEPDLDIGPGLLQSMRIAIGGRSVRRFSRTQFRPRGDLVTGLIPVINFLDGNSFSRRAIDNPRQSSERDFLPSEWALMDESPDGFRLRFIKGERRQLASGEIVALQPRESSKIHVGLVRRIATSHLRLEVGLQLVSPLFSVVEVFPEGGKALRALFFHSLPSHGRYSGLMTPPGTCHHEQTVVVKLPGRVLHRKIGTCIEANEGLEFFALEPLPD